MTPYALVRNCNYSNKKTASKHEVERGTGDKTPISEKKTTENHCYCKNIKNDFYCENKSALKNKLTIGTTHQNQKDNGNLYDYETDNMKNKSFKQKRRKIESAILFSSHSFPNNRQTISPKDIRATTSIERSKTEINEYKPIKKGKTYESDRIVSYETYCCSSTDDASKEEHIYKIIQRKAKLNNLLRSLIELRKKEKQEWNDFITELKNKHGFNSESEHHIEKLWEPSQDCKKIISDLYESGSPRGLEEFSSKQSKEEFLLEKEEDSHGMFKNDFFCYPTSSSGRLSILQRQKEALKTKIKKSGYKGMDSNNDDIKAESKYQSNYPNYLGRNNSAKRTTSIENYAHVLPVEVTPKQSFIIQDDHKQNERTNMKERKALIDTLSKINFTTKAVEVNGFSDNTSLASIEAKLEELIRSINSLVTEMQITKSLNVPKDSKNCDGANHKKVIFDENVPRMSHEESHEYGVAIDSFEDIFKLKNNAVYVRPAKSYSSHEIISRKRYKTVQQHLDEVPSKDIGTIVTESLSKTGILKKVASSPSHVQHQMSVNTRPLGFLSLMRISAEALKGFLSYLPLVNGADLPVHRLPPMEMSRYVCSICGQAFDRASQLSEHVDRSHCYGMARDCCVCRHLLHKDLGPPGLFVCRFCGERFTRSYCCELHQSSCAKALGLKNDVDSRLLILR